MWISALAGLEHLEGLNAGLKHCHPTAKCHESAVQSLLNENGSHCETQEIQNYFAMAIDEIANSTTFSPTPPLYTIQGGKSLWLHQKQQTIMLKFHLKRPSSSFSRSCFLNGLTVSLNIAILIS
jgi:hypothetical protein